MFRSICAVFLFFAIMLAADGAVGDSSMTSVEGTLEAVSSFPDPAQSDYADCYYSAKFTVNSIRSGESVPRIIQLVIPAFADRKLSQLSQMKSGEIYKLKIHPFELLDKEEQSIQLADELNLLNLDRFFVVDGQKITDFATGGTKIPFKGGVQYTSLFDLDFNPPITEEAKKAQKIAIEKERKKVNSLLASIAGREQEINDQFREVWKARQQDLAEVRPEFFWMKIGKTYVACPGWHRLINIDGRIPEENVEAVVGLKEVLEANGIQLIVQMTPFYWDHAARLMNPEFREVPDYNTLILAKQLLDRGVETQYCSDYLLDNFERKEFMFFYPHNNHPADGCQDLMTELVAERLERFGDVFKEDALDLTKFSSERGLTCYGKDLNYSWPENPKADVGDNKRGESFMCDHLLYDGQPLKAYPKSKVFVIGNSFIGSPMPQDTSYGTYLAQKIGHAPDYIVGHGYGPHLTIPLNFIINPRKYFKGKVVMILTMAPHHWIANVPFTNLKLIDAQRKMLSGTTLAGNIKPGVGSPSREVAAAFDKLKNNNGNRWEQFVNQHKATQFVIKSKDSWEPLGEFDISKFASESDNSFVSIQLASYMCMMVDVRIGLEERTLATGNFAPSEQTLVFPVKPGTQKIKLEVKTRQPGTLIAIKNISVYN